MPRRPVEVLFRDICEGSVNLTLLPCSGKIKAAVDEKKWTQDRIDQYGLPEPKDFKGRFKYAEISPTFEPIRNQGRIDFFAFAASVYNKSDANGLEELGARIGELTVRDGRIRTVEAPFLGCGSGGMSPDVAMFALAKGFLRTRHVDAVLHLCNYSSLNVKLANSAIEYLLGDQPRLDKAIGANPREYDIAFSFAGEQRKFVQSLTYLLKANGVRIYYDTDEMHDLWGKHGNEALFEVYAHKAHYCVIVVSKEYLEKPWTNIERRAAQDRAFRQIDEEYILPIRVDDSVLPSLPSTVIYLTFDLENGNVFSIFELIMKKLRRR